jgi:hypothetical protein
MVFLFLNIKKQNTKITLKCHRQIRVPFLIAANTPPYRWLRKIKGRSVRETIFYKETYYFLISRSNVHLKKIVRILFYF